MEPQTINYADAEVTYAVIEQGDLLQVGQPTNIPSPPPVTGRT